MSKMMMRSYQKPPLPKSPARLLHPRRVLRSSAQYTHQSPPAASLIKTPLATRSLNIKEMELRPEYHAISSEFRALAKMVRDEFGKPDLGKTDSEILCGSVPNSVFERGRFYDEYSARRNERLKRKRGQTEEEKENKNTSDLGVAVQSVQKTEMKRREAAKRVVVSTPMTENRVGNSRYMLRSMNSENKKPPLPVKYEGSTVGKSVTRRARKI